MANMSRKDPTGCSFTLWCSCWWDAQGKFQQVDYAYIELGCFWLSDQIEKGGHLPLGRGHGCLKSFLLLSITDPSMRVGQIPMTSTAIVAMKHS